MDEMNNNQTENTDIYNAPEETTDVYNTPEETADVYNTPAYTTNIYNAPADTQNMQVPYPQKKPIHVPGLVLMVVGAVFALLLPIVTYPCSIISLVFSITKRKEYTTTYAIVINIIALILALINSILGAALALSKYF